ncbi:MAG: sulfurtransferase, partial [Acidimicrobiia bacterium]|nr:sulfurtransferase [Acidimicrobiia bacterium]
MSWDSPIVSCAWLADRLDDQMVRIVDTRWFLGEPGVGRLRYQKDHIPGAVFMDLDEDLAATEGPGRHPLPSREDFADLLGRNGIGNQHQVVVYDQGPGAIAARLWWMLRSVGHFSVSVLDGGYGKWLDNGHPIDSSEPSVTPGVFTVDTGPTRIVDRDRLLDRLGSVQVLDAREPERYRGEIEPIDQVAGHIPTALPSPVAENVNPDGTFKSASALAARFAELGLDPYLPVVSYCGSGGTAC